MNTTEEKPKIFVFVNGGFANHLVGCAVSEDGYHLAGHASSSIGFVKHDMGLTSDWKHEHYREHYPNGFELVDLTELDADELRTHEGLSAAAEKAKAAKATEVSR